MNNIRFVDINKTNEEIDFLNGILDTNVQIKIRKKDGTELFKDLGPNASLIGGIQDYIKAMWSVQSSDQIKISTFDDEFTGLPTPNYTSNNRVIFGYGIATDGAFGNSINVVRRHDKGFNKDKMISFVTENKTLDDPDGYFKKYAFRVEDSGDVLYYIKLLTPKYRVISAKSKTLLVNYPDKTYNQTEDVRGHIQIESKITTDECTRWFGKKTGTSDNAYFNSIILFAGRPCSVVENGKTVNTYRDVIATNRINFKNIALNDTEISFVYSIYFV